MEASAWESPLWGEVGLQVLTDTHAEVVGVVEVPKTQNQFLVLAGALRGQSGAWSTRDPPPGSLYAPEKTFPGPAGLPETLWVLPWPCRAQGWSL